MPHAEGSGDHRARFRHCFRHGERRHRDGHNDTSDGGSVGKSAKVAKRDTEYRIHPLRTIIVKEGAHVEKGDFMTDGSADLEDIFMLGGKEQAQEYIIGEITRIYELQGVSTARKHLEIIVKQMFSRVGVSPSGDTGVSAGDIIADFEFERINKR